MLPRIIGVIIGVLPFFALAVSLGAFVRVKGGFAPPTGAFATGTLGTEIIAGSDLPKDTVKNNTREEHAGNDDCVADGLAYAHQNRGLDILERAGEIAGVKLC